MSFARPVMSALLVAMLLVPAVSVAAPVGLLLPGGSGASTPRETGERVEVQLVRPSGTDGSNGTNYWDEAPTLQTRHFGPAAELSCSVADTPKALVVVNHGNEPLPAGTRIKWTLASEGQRGFFALLGPLDGGETLIADDVLEAGVDSGANCVARTI